MSLTALAASGGGNLYGDGLLSPEEAAARLRCSAYTLANWRRDGCGPKWRRIGPKRVAYTVGDLNDFLATTVGA